MSAALGLGLGLLFAMFGRAWSMRERGMPGILFLLGLVWALAFLGLAMMSSILDYDAVGLLRLGLPLVLLLLVCRSGWFRRAPVELPCLEGRYWGVVVLGFGIVASLLMGFDLLRTLSFGGEAGLARALADARISRQEGNFYPVWLLPLNSLRILAAPVCWVLYSRLEPGRWKQLAAVASLVALLSTVTTTGRITFVLNLLWMAGISWSLHADRWGWRGLLRRAGILGLGSAGFFILFGLLIGKSGEALAGRLLGTAEVAPLLAATLSFGLYALGPLAAAANSTLHAAGPEFQWNLLYVPMRLLEFLGFSMPEFQRSLPYVNIPEPFNTYSFLGPGWWLGGTAGLVGYLLLVIGCLLLSERWLAQAAHPERILLHGYLVAASVLSLFADYFFSAGFALLLYGLVGTVAVLRARGMLR